MGAGKSSISAKVVQLQIDEFRADGGRFTKIGGANGFYHVSMFGHTAVGSTISEAITRVRTLVDIARMSDEYKRLKEIE